jgi:hypothetical protein
MASGPTALRGLLSFQVHDKQVHGDADNRPQELMSRWHMHGVLPSDRNVRTETVPDEDQEQQRDDNDTARGVVRLETTLTGMVPRQIKTHGTLPYDKNTFPAIATSLVSTVSVPLVRTP